MVIIISKSRSNLGCQGPSPDEAHRLASKEHPTVSEQQATRGRLMRGGGQTRSSASDMSPTYPTQWKTWPVFNGTVQAPNRT